MLGRGERDAVSKHLEIPEGLREFYGEPRIVGVELTVETVTTTVEAVTVEASDRAMLEWDLGRF